MFTALARLYGTGTSQRSFRKSDFHVAATEENLTSGATLSIDCIFALPELEDDDTAEASGVPEVFGQMVTEGEDAAVKVRMRLEAAWIDDGTPEGTIEESFRWIDTLDDEYVWEECRPVQNVERNFIQLIYVPALRNAADQVTNLLKGRLWRAARWSDQMQATTATASNLLQTDFDDEDPTVFILERLSARWTQVHQADTDKTPKLRLVASALEELVRRAEFVFVPNEAGQQRRLEELSDGQKSLFQIALTAATLEIETDALKATTADATFDQEKMRRTYLTILAIEEPENSLSPFFLSRVMGLARDIGGMSNAQVVVSSHSASILARVEPEEVRHTRLIPSSRSSVVNPLRLPPSSGEANRFVRLAVKAYPELYFARYVILAEGESEAIVLPRLAEALNFPLDRSFIPIVPLAGRFVRHFWRLLNGLGIPFATLLDLDLGRRHGGVARLQEAVKELAEIGNDLSHNHLIQDGTIDPNTLDDITEEELLDQDQTHPWLEALRREGVFFSTPLDLDFAMLRLFRDAYRITRAGGKGPRTSETAVTRKKLTTLKTGGNVALYDDSWDEEFVWYPYLFLGESKPEAHLRALAEIDDLADSAPYELLELIRRVRTSVGG